MKDKKHAQSSKSQPGRHPQSPYYFRREAQKKRLSDSREILLYMAQRCLCEWEATMIEELICDPSWVKKRALTSAIAQDKDILGVGFFHPRWRELGRILTKFNLPYRLFQHPNPNGQGVLYFLVFTGHGEPPSQHEVRRLLTPSKEDDSDNDDGALIPS